MPSGRITVKAGAKVWLIGNVRGKYAKCHALFGQPKGGTKSLSFTHSANITQDRAFVYNCDCPSQKKSVYTQLVQVAILKNIKTDKKACYYSGH